jgi:hypothetical protein
VRGLPSETCLNQTALLLRFTGNPSHTSNAFQVAFPPAPSTPGPRPRARTPVWGGSFLAFSASPSHRNSHIPLPVALRLWPHVSPLARLVEGEERPPSALGARPWSLRHLPLTPVAASALPTVGSRPLPPETRKETSSGKTGPSFAPHEEVHRRCVLFGLRSRPRPPHRLLGLPASQGWFRGEFVPDNPSPRKGTKRGGFSGKS